MEARFEQPRELVEARDFVNSLFLDDVVNFLRIKAERPPETKLDYDNPQCEEDEEWRNFLLELDRKTIAKIQELPEDRKRLAATIAVVQNESEGGHFVFPVSVYNGLQRSGEELRLRGMIAF